jgi:hypothetical protein
MKTERIDLPNGEWWEIQTVYTVGVARRMEEAIRHELVATNLDEVEKGESKELKIEMKVDAVDILKNQRALVFALTKSWSYGEVSQEVFDNEVPQDDYNVVSRRCDELFGSSPLPLRLTD